MANYTTYSKDDDLDEKVYHGYSWPCLLFGVFWFIHKRMWSWSVIAFILMVISFGVSHLIWPFFANSIHKDYVVKKGYEEKKGDGSRLTD